MTFNRRDRQNCINKHNSGQCGTLFSISISTMALSFYFGTHNIAAKNVDSILFILVSLKFLSSVELISLDLA